MRVLSFIASLSLIMHAQAQTIAEYLRTRPDLSKTALAIAQNPLWSDSTQTSVALFAPLDAESTPFSSRPGTLTTITKITYQDPLLFHYTALSDATSSLRVIFDNHDNTLALPTQVHIRYGYGETMVVEYHALSNGQLFIMAGAIPSPPQLFTLLSSLPNFRDISNFIVSRGLIAQVNAMKGTFLATMDSLKIDLNLNYRSVDAGAAFLQAHFLTQSVTSNSVSPGVFTNYLGGSVVLAVSGNKVMTVNGVSMGGPADIFADSVVIQPLLGAMFPNVIVPVAWPADMSTPTAGTSTKKVASSALSNVMSSGISFFLSGYFLLMMIQ